MPKLITVPPIGPITATMALVGEAPGEDEIEHDPPTPFVGQAGQRLDSLLSQAGILRSQVRILNVMPIRPPSNDFSFFWENSTKGVSKNTQPKPMLSKGINLLWYHLSEMPNLKVIVALGRQPMYILTRKKQDGISKWRGNISIIEYCRTTNRIFEGKQVKITDDISIKLISTFHPSFALKQWTVNPLIVHDLKRAKEEVNNGLGLPVRDLNAYPTRDEIKLFFIEYKNFKQLQINKDKDTPILYCDIETLNNMISRISFSHNPNYAISIPFFNLDTMSTTHWYYDEWVWDQIRSVMLNSPIGGQNFGSYDRLWLLKRRNVVINNLVHDTMIAQHIIMPGLGSGGDEDKQLGRKSSSGMKPFSLEMLTSIYTREPYYKYIGKITKKKKPTDVAYGKYSCLDSAVTCEVGQRQIQTALFKSRKKFFDHEMKLINGPIRYMMQRGIKVDLEMRNQLRARYSSEVEWLELTIKDKIGRDINVRSTQQLAVLLYDEMKLKGPKSRSTKAEELFISKAKYPKVEILDMITQHKRISKVLSNVLEAKVDDDGRMRCSYSPTTISGRFKSYENPLGTGTNLQNIPKRRDKKIRPMFVADEGCYLVEADLKGAEIYPVAYLSGDRRMISMLEKGQDIHEETARIVLGKKDISKYDRETGKTVRHGAHYCMSNVGVVRILRLWNEINVSRFTAQQMLNRIYSYNPSLKLWHRKVEADLSRQNMTLINPLGREIKFFDRYGPDLFRKAINWLAQSCIADLLNFIMNDWFERYNNKHEHAPELLLQLHDAFYTQCHKSNIHCHLSNLKECFNHPITINRHKVVIPVKFKVTERWGGEEIKI